MVSIDAQTIELEPIVVGSVSGLGTAGSACERIMKMSSATAQLSKTPRGLLVYDTVLEGGYGKDFLQHRILIRNY